MPPKTLTIRASRRGLHEITQEINAAVRESRVRDGVCFIFIQHTSASLIINENYDLGAREDLEQFLDDLVPHDGKRYRHSLEGSDDMPSHIKSALTQVSISVPVVGGKLALGTWQGIYLWEHRDRPQARSIVVSII